MPMATSPDPAAPRTDSTSLPQPAGAPAAVEGIATALGRIPSGLFVISWRHDGVDRTMLASWVMQAGFSPPAVSVAVAPTRELVAAIDRGIPFVVNILGVGSGAGGPAGRPPGTIWWSSPRWSGEIPGRPASPSCMCGKMGYVTELGGRSAAAG